MDDLPVLIISPHPDDLAFSLGGSLAIRTSRRPIKVINLFSQQTYTVLRDDQGIARRTILSEEQQVAKRLRYDVQNVNFPEAGLRGYKRLRDILSGIKIPRLSAQDREVALEIECLLFRILRKLRPEILLCPLGLGHVDHYITRITVIDVLTNFKGEHPYLFFYEDLPYCVDYRVVCVAHRQLEDSGFMLRSHLIKISNINEKQLILNMYKSQIRDRQLRTILRYAHSHSVSPAERIWSARLER